MRHKAIATSARPVMTAFDVMGGSLIFMMCCWQIPKLFAAVIGGSPALTGGDLVATAAVVGGAALAVGGAAVAGAGALAGGGAARRRAPVLRRAPEGRAPARRLRLRASDRWEQVRPPEEVRCRRLSPSPGSRVRRMRRQPDPPSMVQATVRGQPQGSPASAEKDDAGERIERNRRAGLHRFRQRCRRLAVSRWRVLGLRRNRLSGASRRLSVTASDAVLQPGPVRLLLFSRTRRTASLLPVARGSRLLRLTSPVQAALGLCPMSPPSGSAVPQVRNRPHQRRKERAYSRRRSGQELAAQARITAIGCRAACHATKNSNRSRGVTESS